MTNVCPALARDARGRGVARIVVGSELDFEPRLFTCTRAADGRRASGTIVRVFDAVCFEKCVAGGRGCVRGEFSNGSTDQARALPDASLRRDKRAEPPSKNNIQSCRRVRRASSLPC